MTLHSIQDVMNLFPDDARPTRRALVREALKEAGGWEKLAIVDSHYGHMELSDVHDFMRKLSERKE